MSWWCTKCGRQASPGPAIPKGQTAVPPPYTRIDSRQRYDLGTCACTEDDQVELVNDKLLAEILVAERLDRFRSRMGARDALDPKDRSGAKPLPQ